MSSINQIAISHFGRKTVKALAGKKITLVDLTYVPGPGGDFANGETGYVINNDGQGQVKTYLEVLALVK